MIHTYTFNFQINVPNFYFYINQIVSKKKENQTKNNQNINWQKILNIAFINLILKNQHAQCIIYII